MYYMFNLRRVDPLVKINEEDDIPRTIIKRKKTYLTFLKIYVVCFIWCGLGLSNSVMTYFTLLVNSTRYTSNKH